MNENTTRNGRVTMAVVSFFAGLALIIVLPLICMPAMETVLKGVETRYMLFKEPNILSAKGIFEFFYSLLTGLSIAAGGLLILFFVPLYRGDKWSRPIALCVAAIPSITGAYMFGPILLFAKEYLYTVGVVILLGLIPYFLILLLDKSSGINKLVNLLLFLLLGVEIAYSMVNGISSTRMYTGWGEHARTLEYFLYAFGVPVIWTGCLLGFVGIPFYSSRRDYGWWLVTGGSLLMLIGTIQFLIAEQNGWFVTGLILCIAILIPLLIPTIGGRPISKDGKTGMTIQLKRVEESI
ncbi:MAG: hypothetical protein AB7V16_08920 [Vulcanibacillus sp.]